MPDLQANNIDVSGHSYKNFLLTRDIKNKLDSKYGEQLARDIESKYSAGVANGYSFLRNDRFKRNILWASGKINVRAMFSDLLALNGKINYANINWKAPMIVNRIISGLVGRWMQRREKIQVTAIDPISVEAKVEQYEQAEFVLYNREQLAMLQQESGVPMVPPTQFVAEDKDDLEEWAISGNQLPEEIKYETGTNDILQSNGFFDVLKEKLLHDSAECGLVGTYVWMDENGVIHIEWVKPMNGFYTYSEYNDFRDTAIRGFVKSLKISELRKKYGKEFGGEFDEEEIFKIAQSSQEYQRFDKLTWNSDWFLSYIRPYDEWSIECLYFWIKSVDDDSYVTTVTKKNQSTIIERRQQAPQNLGENQEYTKTDKWNLYKGVWARTPMKILEWGLDNNMIRPQDPTEMGDVEFPISFYMYQNQDMRNVAVPEKIEEPVEQMILARLKIQQLVATMVPAGAAINVDAMQEVELGLAADGQSPINVQKVYEQTGKLYYRGRDAEGNPIPLPIQELQNAGFINQMNGLIQVYQYHSNVLKDELGEDPNLITSAVQPRVTSDNVQASQMQAAYATDYIYTAYQNVMEQTAKKVACLLNNSVRFGAKAYRHIMGQEDVKDRNFSTKFQLLPDQLEIQKFEAFMNQALAANPPLINYLDPFKLMRIAKENVKLAELYFRNSMKRMIRSEQERAQQQSEQNAQVQAMAAQQKAQGDMHLLEVQNKMKAIEIDTQSQNKKEEIVLQGYFELLKVGVQMPPEMKQIINALVPNIAIPIAQENQETTQQVAMQQMAAMQQQQEQVPEDEMAMQEQQQMLPQQ